METKQKAKKIIKELDFSGEGCAVSLVGPSVGSAANGKKTVIMKSKAPKVSDEFIKKASQVKVTMEITDFLTKFYGLWYDDAEVLARALGLTTKEQDYITANPDNQDTWYEDYITQKVDSIEVMKSLYQSENMADVLAELDGPSYLKLVQDQAMLEKSFRKIERISKAATKESKPQGTDTSKSNEVKEGVSNPVVKQVNKDNKNMEEMETLQKSLNDQKEMLAKALAQIETFEKEKKEAIVKSKTDKITAVIKDAKHAAAVTKACLELESDEDFDAFLSAITAMANAVVTTDMFVEKGVQVSGEDKQAPNVLENILKAKYTS